jgi:hypothetical protein
VKRKSLNRLATPFKFHPEEMPNSIFSYQKFSFKLLMKLNYMHLVKLLQLLQELLKIYQDLDSLRFLVPRFSLMNRKKKMGKEEEKE